MAQRASGLFLGIEVCFLYMLMYPYPNLRLDELVLERTGPEYLQIPLIVDISGAVLLTIGNLEGGDHPSDKIRPENRGRSQLQTLKRRRNSISSADEPEQARPSKTSRRFSTPHPLAKPARAQKGRSRIAKSSAMPVSSARAAGIEVEDAPPAAPRHPVSSIQLEQPEEPQSRVSVPPSGFDCVSPRHRSETPVIDVTEVRTTYNGRYFNDDLNRTAVAAEHDNRQPHHQYQYPLHSDGIVEARAIDNRFPDNERLPIHYPKYRAGQLLQHGIQGGRHQYNNDRHHGWQPHQRGDREDFTDGRHPGGYDLSRNDHPRGPLLYSRRYDREGSVHSQWSDPASYWDEHGTSEFDYGVDGRYRAGRRGPTNDRQYNGGFIY